MELTNKFYSQYDPELGRLMTSSNEERNQRLLKMYPPKKHRGFKKSRVLVLDKDTSLGCHKKEMGVLSYCLKNFNCEIDEALTLQEFISKLGSQHYDYIFIDYNKYIDAYGLTFDKIVIELLSDFHLDNSNTPKVINYTEDMSMSTPKGIVGHWRKGASLSDTFEKFYDLVSADNDVPIHSRRHSKARNSATDKPADDKLSTTTAMEVA
ncbi:MAG: hypothetical protein CL677_01760 [Bdellovibrionaceae bacterium]|nr:hypothetical protein [Pseudobdellovibrionaceae bacterium]|tara:strand:+ start:3801 stop:4427 length:627 start_codon:yes stop_codon:yes gene_type:complete